VAPDIEEWVFDVKNSFGKVERRVDYFFRSGSYDFAVLGVAKGTRSRARFESARRNALAVVAAVQSPARLDAQDELRTIQAIPYDWRRVRASASGLRRLVFVSPDHVAAANGSSGARVLVDRTLNSKSGSSFAAEHPHSLKPPTRTISLEGAATRRLNESVYVATSDRERVARYVSYYFTVGGHRYAVEGVAERRLGGNPFVSVRAIALSVARSLSRTRSTQRPLGVSPHSPKDSSGR
jgi:hypothetical protein